MKNIVIIIAAVILGVFTSCKAGEPVKQGSHIAMFSFDAEQCEPLASANGHHWLDYWDSDCFDYDNMDCHVYWDDNNPWIVIDVPEELWLDLIVDYNLFHQGDAPLHNYGILFEESSATLVLQSFDEE